MYNFISESKILQHIYSREYLAKESRACIEVKHWIIVKFTSQPWSLLLSLDSQLGVEIRVTVLSCPIAQQMKMRQCSVTHPKYEQDGDNGPRW
ncbi:hypothetical protein XELAEV_18038357mg [Xenopus laevis]|uniref:Uncharacterized protein n=1 Tax=Xenopus laevis TaxID=8355 RepID=A0A974C5U2_XENLA|nr:hypothetical protein XELAEV_18038357mg [Xenopus laevis]